ncbi:MAG: hypothetical protein HYT73_02310 [Candidatus Aenigmarchaeota archaeon]|nr:hypothetical protein [Candidatus Aenigmarchaeota archaeon]
MTEYEMERGIGIGLCQRGGAIMLQIYEDGKLVSDVPINDPATDVQRAISEYRRQRVEG